MALKKTGCYWQQHKGWVFCGKSDYIIIGWQQEVENTLDIRIKNGKVSYKEKKKEEQRTNSILFSEKNIVEVIK